MTTPYIIALENITGLAEDIPDLRALSQSLMTIICGTPYTGVLTRHSNSSCHLEVTADDEAGPEFDRFVEVLAAVAGYTLTVKVSYVPEGAET